MKLVMVLLCVCQVWILCAGNQKKSHIDFYDNIPVVHLYGSPTQMAKDYARLVKKPLVGAVSMLKLFYGKRLKYLYKRATRLESALPKHIKNEMRILARETGLSYDDIVTVNIIPEIQCSTVSVWGTHTKNNQLIMGRNLDFYIGKLDSMAGLVTVYHYEKGKQVLTISFLGMTGGFTGVNSDNVCFGNMIISNAKVNYVNENGLSIQFILRDTARRAGTAEVFAEMLSRQRPSSPMNVMVADSKEALVVEMGVSDSAIRDSQGQQCLFATNHFKTSKMSSRSVYCNRYNILDRLIHEKIKNFSEGDMKKVVAQARIPDINLQAAIFVPERKVLYLSMNSSNASKRKYTVFDTGKLFKDDGDPVILPGGPSANAAYIKMLYKEFQ